MKNRWRLTFRAMCDALVSKIRVRETRGSEIAEAALVLPLMFMMLLGIFWFGQAFSMYGTITHAARQGARAAVAPVCTTCGAPNTQAQIDQNAYNAIQSALLAARLNPTYLSQPTSPPALCPCGSANATCTGASAVQCDGGQSSVCVQPNVRLSASALGGTDECGTSVSFQYQYPHHFYLPCAEWPCHTLDLGQMALPAQAQMRVETQ